MRKLLLSSTMLSVVTLAGFTSSTMAQNAGTVCLERSSNACVLGSMNGALYSGAITQDLNEYEWHFDYESGGTVNLSGNADTVSNYGTLLDTHAGGVLELDFGGGNDIFTSYGDIKADIHMGDDNDIFTNSGTVSGKVDLGGDRDTFVLNGAPDDISGFVDGGETGDDLDTLTLKGTSEYGLTTEHLNHIINFEALNVAGGFWASTADLEFESAVINGGELKLMNNTESSLGTTDIFNGRLMVDGLLTSAVRVNNGGRLNGNGTIIGNVDNRTGATISPNEHGNIGVLTIEGDYTARAGSVLQLDVDPLNGTADQLNVTGDFLAYNGASLIFNPLSEFNPDQPMALTVGHVGGTVLRNYVADLGENTGYNATPIDPETGLQGVGNYLVLWLGTDLIPDIIDDGDPEPEDVEVPVDIVDTLVDEGDIPVAAAITAIVASGDHDALTPLKPELYGAVYKGGADASLGYGRYLIERIDDREHCGTLKGIGQENCRTLQDGTNLWGNLEGDFSHLETGKFLRADINTYHAAFGADQRFASSTLGLTAGYSRTKGDTTTMGDFTSNSAHVGGYISQHVRYFNLDAAASYTYGWGEGTRHIDKLWGTPVNQNFGAETKSHAGMAMARLTQEYQWKSGWEFQPEAGLDYYIARYAGFEETPVDENKTALGLTVDGYTHDQMGVFGGLQVRRAFKSNDVNVVPEIRGKARQIVMGEQLNIPAAFTLDTVNSDFASTIEMSKYEFTLGAGVNVESPSGFMIYGDYDYTFTDDASYGHNVSAGLRFKF